MKRYVDRKQEEVEKYKIRNLVLLSTKDLKWQIVKRRLEKLTEQFVGPYRVKRIFLTNTIKLELSGSIKIYSIVNVS